MMDGNSYKYQRANFMLRLPHDLAEDIKTIAKREGCSHNYLAVRMLTEKVKEIESGSSITNRLARMGVV